jgi:hypothetical protein
MCLQTSDFTERQDLSEFLRNKNKKEDAVVIQLNGKDFRVYGNKKSKKSVFQCVHCKKEYRFTLYNTSSLPMVLFKHRCEVVTW